MSHVELSRDGSFAIISLRHPQIGNALSAEMVDQLTDAFESALATPDISTVVFQGEGKHFCTGFDLSRLETETDATLLQRFVRIEMLLDRIWRAPLRTAAIGQGRVTGAGADIFTVCDHRILREGASLTYPGAGFGIVLGTRRLAERIGEDRALRVTSGAGQISLRQALDWQLATAIAAVQEAEPWQSLPPIVSRETLAALRHTAQKDDSDRDLASLVRSAARPGLKQRIIAYRAQMIARGAS